MEKHSEKQAELLLPFLCAIAVLIVSMYSQFIAVAFSVISLVGIGAYYYYLKK